MWRIQDCAVRNIIFRRTIVSVCVVNYNISRGSGKLNHAGFQKNTNTNFFDEQKIKIQIQIKIKNDRRLKRFKVCAISLRSLIPPLLPPFPTTHRVWTNLMTGRIGGRASVRPYPARGYTPMSSKSNRSDQIITVQ